MDEEKRDRLVRPSTIKNKLEYFSKLENDSPIGERTNK